MRTSRAPASESDSFVLLRPRLDQDRAVAIALDSPSVKDRDPQRAGWADAPATDRNIAHQPAGASSSWLQCRETCNPMPFACRGHLAIQISRESLARWKECGKRWQVRRD